MSKKKTNWGSSRLAPIPNIPFPQPKSAIFFPKIPPEFSFIIEIIVAAISTGVAYCSSLTFLFSIKANRDNSYLIFLSFIR
ncbi:hypothetical protein MXB_566 [Myxobolus squamalis]|nr:hypothetical protein MXB_566 [Myxobolus squamalis]